MQWARVKNILIMILLVVNSFLGVSLTAQYLEVRERQVQLKEDIAYVLAQNGVICGENLKIPVNCSAISLQAERSRQGEETFAKALLGETLQHEESEDGTASYTAAAGQVVWHSDGAVQGWVSYPGELPQGVHAVKQAAQQLLEQGGVSLRGSTWQTEEQAATLTATVAGLPVFGRQLRVRFAEGHITVTGCWTFETPYASTSDKARTYDAGDALISFVRQNPGVTRIDALDFGYHLLPGTSGRLQLAPVWRVRTSTGDMLYDALKKTI